MFPNGNLISCNFTSFPLKNPNFKISAQNPGLKTSFLRSSFSFTFLKPRKYRTTISTLHKKGLLQSCQSSMNTQNSQDPIFKKEASLENELGGNGSPGGDEGDWTTSILLFMLWAGLMYYVFNLTPDQTPSRDMYFLKKLLNLMGDDGFQMNEVLVSLWYIMGLWPLVYSMLLLPTGRSSKSKIPVWPFLILSCFGGAYTLLPYFVLWRPPPPPVEETELRRWPLNFLESKLTAGISLAAGLGIIIYAGLANGDVWKEFYQYFRESKFIHVTCIDFTLLSTFAPFWVYNDMTTRKWYDKGSWLLPLSLIPFLGPALYLLLRPSLSSVPVSLSPTKLEEK
uniref:Cardiolipin synthase N-terminal domain-containing protein n=1 Tax=Davidia involucrata TaxID=16924 RepID=A0A5B7AG24_DAVIN